MHANFALRFQNFIVHHRTAGSDAPLTLALQVSQESFSGVRHFDLWQREERVGLAPEGDGDIESGEPAELFDNVLALAFTYSKDKSTGSTRKLPCTLRLPQTLRDADSRQSLTSMALLGKGEGESALSF